MHSLLSHTQQELSSNKNNSTGQKFEPMSQKQQKYLCYLIKVQFCKQTNQVYERRNGIQYYFEQVVRNIRPELLYSHWQDLTRNEASDIINLIDSGVAAEKYKIYINQFYKKTVYPEVSELLNLELKP